MSSDQFSSNRVIYYNSVTDCLAPTQHTDVTEVTIKISIMESSFLSSDLERGLIYQGSNFNVDILYSLLPLILLLGKITREIPDDF